jgi:peptidoglycan/LPS O-acetylase OafA/YrhL
MEVAEAVPAARLDVAPRRRTTLGDAFDPRRNAVGFLRLAAAALVVISHTFPLGGLGTEPLIAVTGQETLGGIAVAAFFVLSGFLVTRSVVRSPGTGRFLRRRALRILPGYWVCLVVTAFGFGALFWWREYGTLSGFVGQPDGPFRYLERNWLVRIRQWDLDGLGDLPHPNALNGSLWTLLDEVRCYVVLAGLAALGVIRKGRSPVLLAMTGFWWMATVVPVPFDTGPWFQLKDRMLAVHALAFFLGALAYVYADRIPLSRGGAAVAAAALVVAFATHTYDLAGIFPLAYLVVFAAVEAPFTRVNTTTDISYGVYIYAFPVQQSLAAFGVASAGIIPFLALALTFTGVLALLSWKLVEKPMMRLR